MFGCWRLTRPRPCVLALPCGGDLTGRVVGREQRVEPSARLVAEAVRADPRYFGRPTVLVSRFPAFFTTVPTDVMDTVAADRTHRGHAIIEQVFDASRAPPSPTCPPAGSTRTAPGSSSPSSHSTHGWGAGTIAGGSHGRNPGQPDNTWNPPRKNRPAEINHASDRNRARNDNQSRNTSPICVFRLSAKNRIS